MSMVLIGRRLSPEELTAVLADPTAVDRLLYGDLDDDEAEMPEPELDLDKSWHGIHYLLTGTGWQVSEGAGTAILGGVEIGPDGGYGPPRLLDRDTVRAVAAALDALDVETLRARFDPGAMAAADIYPDIWTNGIDEIDYLMSHFDHLRRFYHAAAVNSQAVLVAIT
ncbi:YfbM family protein [Micromonospora sp. R77]|uniref:YfbM family protein n=1 Tax=Micromonospora sp. R77 TaxID=2925836 RepID=UPI001F61E1ED|nr:YfbM family protein [Micromonospora sp. R77]MCI4066073.1 YfbM family protein [Micromonospora sp. R77]